MESKPLLRQVVNTIPAFKGQGTSSYSHIYSPQTENTKRVNSELKNLHEDEFGGKTPVSIRRITRCFVTRRCKIFPRLSNLGITYS
jgi:hypothetical protein